MTPVSQTSDLSLRSRSMADCCPRLLLNHTPNMAERRPVHRSLIYSSEKNIKIGSPCHMPPDLWPSRAAGVQLPCCRRPLSLLTTGQLLWGWVPLHQMAVLGCFGHFHVSQCCLISLVTPRLLALSRTTLIKQKAPGSCPREVLGLTHSWPLQLHVFCTLGRPGIHGLSPAMRGNEETGKGWRRPVGTQKDDSLASLSQDGWSGWRAEGTNPSPRASVSPYVFLRGTGWKLHLLPDIKKMPPSPNNWWSLYPWSKAWSLRKWLPTNWCTPLQGIATYISSISFFFLVRSTLWLSLQVCAGTRRKQRGY